MIDDRLAPWGATVIRLSLGVMWITHAFLKLLVYTPAGFVGFLESQGMPGVLAMPVIIAEIVGGVVILAGFYSRWASLALLPVLAGATVAHAANGWVFSNPNGGWEYPVFLIVVSLAHVLMGDGKLAVTGAFQPTRPLTAARAG
ncbi:MAG TPA: DoxX family protein [Caulobacteraceae bacterium]|nr:DoxX family protein [Caulobacteraceae bacterium]